MAACQAAIDSAEFALWLAYFRLLDAEPSLDEQRADWRHAETMALLANINRDRKARPEPFRVSEFLPRWGAVAAPEPQPQRVTTPVDLQRKINATMAMLGGKVH